MLTGLNLDSLKLKDHERKIIELRKNRLSVAEMSQNELKVLLDVTIFKVSAISGFSLPTTPEFSDVLNDEFRILLSEFGFDNLTFDEIIMAFRMNARGGYRYGSGDPMERIKSYAPFFSIDFAAQILEKYMHHRNIVDGLVKNHLEGYGPGGFDANEVAKKYM